MLSIQTSMEYWDVAGNEAFMRRIRDLKILTENRSFSRSKYPEGKSFVKSKEGEALPDEFEQVDKGNGAQLEVSAACQEGGDNRENMSRLYKVHPSTVNISFPFAIAADELGKDLVGKEILEAKPLAVLPQIPPDGDHTVCINCCKPILWQDNLCRCIDCHWPVCEDACDQQLHSEEECEILAPVRNACHWNKPGGFETLWMIRVLSLKLRDPLAYNIVQKIYVPVGIFDEAETKRSYVALQTLRLMYGIKAKTFSAEEIYHVWNVLRLKCVNSLHSTKENFKLAKLLYEELSIFPHSCYPAVAYRVDPSFKLLVTLHDSVVKNEILTLNYDSSSVFHPTWSRQQRIQMMYKIVCTCERCCDPTEFGTFFSGIPCHDTAACLHSKTRGYLLPKDPSDPKTDWECNRCHSTQFTTLDIQNWLFSIQKGLETCWKKGDPLQVNLFLESLVDQRILHPYHHLVFEYFVATLKLADMKLEVNAEKQGIEILLNYRRAARYVYKIFRVFLAQFSNLVGPVHRMCVLIMLANVIKSFQTGEPDLEAVMRDFEHYALIAIAKDNVSIRKDCSLFVIYRPHEQHDKLKAFIHRILLSLLTHTENFLGRLSGDLETESTKTSKCSKEVQYLGAFAIAMRDYLSAEEVRNSTA